jgi:hypothetical protein
MVAEIHQNGFHEIRTNLSLLLLLASFGFFSPVSAETREVAILYTNDFHGAIGPIRDCWLDQDPVPHLGGAAQLMTMVENIGEREVDTGTSRSMTGCRVYSAIVHAIRMLRNPAFTPGSAS